MTIWGGCGALDDCYGGCVVCRKLNHLNRVLKHVYRIEMIINKVGLEVIWESDNERIYRTVITKGYTGL